MSRFIEITNGGKDWVLFMFYLLDRSPYPQLVGPGKSLKTLLAAETDARVIAAYRARSKGAIRPAEVLGMATFSPDASSSYEMQYVPDQEPCKSIIFRVIGLAEATADRGEEQYEKGA